MRKIHQTTSENGTIASAVKSWPFDNFEDLHERGAVASESVNGNAKILEAYLGSFYDFDSDAANYRSQLFSLQREISNKQALLEEEKRTISALRSDIYQLEEEQNVKVSDKEEAIALQNVEIKRIRGGDYSILGTDADPVNRFAYRLAFVIIAFLTIYLLLFYSSVIYNGFILDPVAAAIKMAGANIPISLTIANMEALPQTYEAHGMWGVVFLISSAFMFIALGFLLHWLNNRRNRNYLYLLYTFTFIFDAFLAYEIVKKIHISGYMAGIETEEWQFSFAFTSVEFYIILFAGFGIYVVWGALLNYLLQEHYKIQPAKAGIRHRRAQIAKLRNDLREIRIHFGAKISEIKKNIHTIEQREIGKLRHEISDAEVQIKSLKEKLQKNLKIHGLSSQRIQSLVTPFFAGWCKKIYEMEPDATKQELLVEKCYDVLEKFYQISFPKNEV